MAFVGSGAGGDKKKDTNADGAWTVTAMEENGKKVPADAIDKLDMKLTIKGDSYTVTMAGKVLDKGTSTRDAQKKPNTLDIKSAEGPNKGKTILAIVEFSGDVMKVCYDLEGKSRPKEFSTKEGSGHVLIVYQREKKDK
jgi:uncharacterized protein (TIGR03067 family)